MIIINRTMELKRRNKIECGCKISPACFCTSIPTGLTVEEIVKTINFERDMKKQCDARDLRKTKGELLNA